MFRRVKCILATAFLVSTVLMSCGGGQTEKSQITSEKSASESKLATSGTVITIEGEEGKSSDINITPKKLTVYTLDGEKNLIVPLATVVTSEDEIKPEDVVNSVLLELEDIIATDISVGIAAENESITVDFEVKDTKYPFGSNNPPESLILDCISYSIFENFSDYTKIYFKTNGEAYNSKQLKLSEEKPFMIDE